MVALFTNSEPVNEGLKQFHINFINIVALIKYTTIFKIYIHWPNTREKRSRQQFFDFFATKTGPMKEVCIIRVAKEFARLNDCILEWLMWKFGKYENQG